MIYILDTVSIILMKGYYSDSFPSFWSKMNKAVSNGEVISVREVHNELHRGPGVPQSLQTWVKENKTIFVKPNSEETEFVGQIFAVRHFEQLVSREQILRGKPSADPFIIAAAKVRNGCVITEEKEKPNAAKIPNVCKHFDIECVNFEEFLNRKKWKF